MRSSNKKYLIVTLRLKSLITLEENITISERLFGSAGFINNKNDDHPFHHKLSTFILCALNDWMKYTHTNCVSPQEPLTDRREIKRPALHMSHVIE